MIEIPRPMGKEKMVETSHQRRQRFEQHLFCRLAWEDLDPNRLHAQMEAAREEDLFGLGLAPKLLRDAPRGDITTRLLDAEKKGRARLVARREVVICGVRLIPLILETYGLARFEAQRQDGDALAKGEFVGELQGSVAVLLEAERLILNVLQKLSGIATLTAAYVAALGDSPTRLLDTRKTTPGWRTLEKYAVACGGGWNHRMGLFDRVMLKDNHLAASEATAGERLASMVALARKRYTQVPVEVEVDAVEQIAPVLDAGADVILFDNFSDAQLIEAVAAVGDRALTEASGGITLERLARLAPMGLDFISCGALIHQSTWMDIGLDWIT